MKTLEFEFSRYFIYLKSTNLDKNVGIWIFPLFSLFKIKIPVFQKKQINFELKKTVTNIFKSSIRATAGRTDRRPPRPTGPQHRPAKTRPAPSPKTGANRRRAATTSRTATGAKSGR